MESKKIATGGLASAIAVIGTFFLHAAGIYPGAAVIAAGATIIQAIGHVIAERL